VVLTLVVGPFGTRMRPTASGQLGPAVLAAHVDTATPPWWRAPRLAERFAAHALLLVLRSGPPTVWAVIALLAMFPGILPGVIALGLYTAGILGRFVAEACESVDTRPRDALRAHGVRPATASLAAVLPPSSHHLLAYTLYRFEICVHDTTVVGVVGIEICVHDTTVVGVVGAAVVEHCTVAGEVCVTPDAVGDALGMR